MLCVLSSCHAPQGDAGQLIVDIAQKEQADILVLGVCVAFASSCRLCSGSTHNACPAYAFKQLWCHT